MMPLVPESASDAASAREAVLAVRTEVAKAVVGQDGTLTGLIAALLVRGHVLLEGRARRREDTAREGGGGSARCRVRTRAVHPGPDAERRARPDDLLDPPRAASGSARVPLFTNLLLADEINRTPPKTQAALLEAMEERQVSIDGTTHRSPIRSSSSRRRTPWSTRAPTRCPKRSSTASCSSSSSAIPTAEQEQEVLARHDAGLDPHDIAAAGVRAVAGPAALAAARGEIAEIRVDPAVLAYIVALARATRESPSLTLGVSPRGAAMLLHAAKAWAWLSGRPFVTPDEVKAVARPAMRHRIQLRAELELEGATADGVLEGILATVSTRDAAAKPTPETRRRSRRHTTRRTDRCPSRRGGSPSSRPRCHHFSSCFLVMGGFGSSS